MLSVGDVLSVSVAEEEIVVVVSAGVDVVVVVEAGAQVLAEAVVVVEVVESL